MAHNSKNAARESISECEWNPGSENGSEPLIYCYGVGENIDPCTATIYDLLCVPM
jgi:hypothetical protein